MASYRARLTKDVDEWIAAGLVPAANRQAILDPIPDYVWEAAVRVRGVWDRGRRAIDRVVRFQRVHVATLPRMGAGFFDRSRDRVQAIAERVEIVFQHHADHRFILDDEDGLAVSHAPLSLVLASHR